MDERHEYISSCFSIVITGFHYFNPLWSSDDICQHRYGRNWLRWWLVAGGTRTITWTKVDFSSKVLDGIHLREILKEMPMNFIRSMCSEITLSKLSLHPISWCLVTHMYIQWRYVLPHPDGKQTLVQIMWCRTAGTTLSETMMASFTAAYMRHLSSMC